MTFLPAQDTFGSRFTKAFTPKFEDAFSKSAERYRQSQAEKAAQQQAEAENEVLGLPKNLYNQKLRESVLEGQQKARAGAGDLAADAQRKDIMTKFFGPEVAELYGTLTEGGKTQLANVAIDAIDRGQSFNDVLIEKLGSNPEQVQQLISDLQQPEQQAQENIAPQENIRQKKQAQLQAKGGVLPEKYKLPDYEKRPTGYTQKDWNNEKKLWRKDNTEQFDKNKTQIQGNDRDKLGVRSLTRLNNSKKLPEGLERLLINPNTGDFYGLADLAGLKSPEAQQWVKEIARFGNRAKDAFGSRVTNFDLQQYMRQFPGLLNTYEGRRRILRMMEINLELDSLYQNVSQQILQKKGLGNIPPEKVDEITRELIRDETEKLQNEYLNIDRENEESLTTPAGQRPDVSQLPAGSVLMLDPQGQPLHVPQDQVDKLIQLGAKLAQ